MHTKNGMKREMIQVKYREIDVKKGIKVKTFRKKR